MTNTNPNFNNIIFFKSMYKLYDNVCEAFGIGVNTLKLSVYTSFLKHEIENIETKEVNII